MPWLAVIFSAPRGASCTFLSASSAAASRPSTSVTAVKSSSPSSVRVRPRAWRWNSGVEISSSSALIWRLTADWLKVSICPAWVKLPALATAWKMRSLSQSIRSPLRRHHREQGPLTTMWRRFPDNAAKCKPLSRRQRQVSSMRGGKKPLRFQGCHATHARCRNGLTEYLILDVTGSENTGNTGMRRVGSCLDVAALVHVELALEQVGGRRMADGDEQPVDID